MMNVTMSHDLRNPLFALISQVLSLSEYLSHFKKVIQEIESIPNQNEQIKTKLSKLLQIYEGCMVCSKKIDNAAKFIDYFAHDILDYSVMMENSNSFTPNLKLVDIREAISQI